MDYIVKDGKVVLNVKDFCIEQILECGQCFRYERIDKKKYIVIANNKILIVQQVDNKLELYCSEKEYKDIWRTYFDLERDYSSIKKKLSDMDEYLKEAIEDKSGVRLLRQEPWEVLFSFIISQNKNIGHIKILVEEISKTYGTYIGNYNGKDYYSFPNVDQLVNVTEDELRELKVGFRAPYLLDAIKKVSSKEVDLKIIESMTYEEGLKSLTQIKGVGKKVADCTLLFGYGKYEVFPTDVWVKRVMEYYYFKEEKKIREIDEFAKEYFGGLAGFAQQYLFYHARDKKIGK